MRKNEVAWTVVLICAGVTVAVQSAAGAAPTEADVEAAMKKAGAF